jgi:formyltetrahydrofolate deformylase
MAKIDFIVSICCTDQKGIINSITGLVYSRNGSIEELNQMVDKETERFYLRAHVISDDYSINFDEVKEDFERLCELKASVIHVFDNSKKLEIMIFTSKSTHCLFDIFQRVRSKEWNVDVQGIVSNNEAHSKFATMFEVPFYYTDSSNKELMEKSQMEIIKSNSPDLIILAKYMQIMSSEILNKIECSIINIHHSFLPSFIGAGPYRAAYNRGVKLIGATSHFVTEKLDAGPIIEQDVLRILPNDIVKDYIRKGKDVEKIVLSRAVKSYIDRKIIVDQNRCIVFN